MRLGDLNKDSFLQMREIEKIFEEIREFKRGSSSEEVLQMALSIYSNRINILIAEEIIGKLDSIQNTVIR